MSEIVLQVENVSKQYRLGQVGTGTIAQDLNRWWHMLRGKEDPYLKVGDINDKSARGGSDFVWSLKDICFDVKKGEVLGIIGKNGAGKSTLLKILSQVTTPTTGQVKIKGRIASLLEVGTGFHPDLTGRENIFLNGAILGMNKMEIKSKLEEIVEFSGVAKYLDTPVKRYSSGMMVRLGFAVAAHLEPEILIVDEVLAVGDAEFQKKCMGKMKDVSGEGRTVLFVSHNMPSIRMLCDSCIFLSKGMLLSKGNTDAIIGEYLNTQLVPHNGLVNITNDQHTSGTGELKYESICLYNSLSQPTATLDFTELFSIEVHATLYTDLKNISLIVFVVNQFGDRILMSSNENQFLPCDLNKGKLKFSVKFNEQLMPGNYSFGLSANFFNSGSDIDFIESCCPFTVYKESKSKNAEYPWTTVHGYIKPNTTWNIIQ